VIRATPSIGSPNSFKDCHLWLDQEAGISAEWELKESIAEKKVKGRCGVNGIVADGSKREKRQSTVINRRTVSTASSQTSLRFRRPFFFS
jgi:hypothetical protein